MATVAHLLFRFTRYHMYLHTTSLVIIIIIVIIVIMVIIIGIIIVMINIMNKDGLRGAWSV